MAPPGSASTSPAAPPRNGLAPSGVRSSTIHQPPALRSGAGVAKRSSTGAPPPSTAGTAAGTVARRVHDEDVARPQVLGQVVEAAVLERPAGALGDHQAHGVAGEAAGLGRLAGLAAAREVERDGAHAAAASTVSAAR